MNKVDPNDIVKWFCAQNIIEHPNSKEGNMKVQKLLFFAQLIYMAKNNGETMFDKEFSAFEHGVVLEPVRKQYFTNYKFYFGNKKFRLPKEVIEILEITKKIFGDSSAQELSDLSHEFDSWEKHYKESINPNSLTGYDSNIAKIPYKELKRELYKIEEVLEAYKQTLEFPDDGVEDY